MIYKELRFVVDTNYSQVSSCLPAWFMSSDALALDPDTDTMDMTMPGNFDQIDTMTDFT